MEGTRWKEQVGNPNTYPVELRTSIRNHVIGAIAADYEDRQMGAKMAQEYDRVLNLWLNSTEDQAPNIAHALTVVWLTSSAVTYSYLVEDIIDITPDNLVNIVGEALIEIERIVNATGDWAWAAHIAQLIITDLIDLKERGEL